MIKDDSKQFVLKIFKRELFIVCFSKYQGWMRFLGSGITWKNTRFILPNFSERNGYVKIFYIGNYRIGFLSNKK